MANRGVHTNGSQFFLCTGRTAHLDGKHVVFGSVTAGEHVLDKIEAVGSKSGKTCTPVVIADCGELKPEAASAPKRAAEATEAAAADGEEASDASAAKKAKPAPPTVGSADDVGLYD